MVGFVSNGLGEYDSDLPSHILKRLQTIAQFMSWNEHMADETACSFESPQLEIVSRLVLEWFLLKYRN